MALKKVSIDLRKSMEPWLPKLEDLPEKAREKRGNEEITTTLLSSTTYQSKVYRLLLARGKHTVVDKEYILRSEHARYHTYGGTRFFFCRAWRSKFIHPGARR